MFEEIVLQIEDCKFLILKIANEIKLHETLGLSLIKKNV